MASSAPISTFISAPDGLRLHVRCYGQRGNEALPVVCLPGLARTAADFEELARVLADDPDRPRCIYALDYRGRGLSDYDPDPNKYSLPTELADLVAILAALDAMPAAFVGTSRGGILTMLLAALQPAAIAGAVLNDIGPVLEPAGLRRIRSYVGKLPQPASFEDGAEILHRLFEAQFPKLTRADWLAAARRTFKQENGALVPTYDVRLAAALDAIDLEQPLTPLWQEFDALGKTPLLVVRGANSDLLSEETVAAMRARHGAMETITVPDQGHAPLLAEPDIVARIAEFVARCDAHNALMHHAHSFGEPQHEEKEEFGFVLPK